MWAVASQCSPALRSNCQFWEGCVIMWFHTLTFAHLLAVAGVLRASAWWKNKRPTCNKNVAIDARTRAVQTWPCNVSFVSTLLEWQLLRGKATAAFQLTSARFCLLFCCKIWCYRTGDWFWSPDHFFKVLCSASKTLLLGLVLLWYGTDWEFLIQTSVYLANTVITL